MFEENQEELMEYKKFRKIALDLAERAGYLYEEDEKTGDVIISGDGESWIGVRSVDMERIEQVVDDDGVTYNPMSWLLNHEMP